jgi:hypothetical protein
MSGQGYHFAVPENTLHALLACQDDMAILDLIDTLHQAWDTDQNDSAGGYKEWDVLHRCLSDGTFDPAGGSYPLNRCFLGGRLLVTDGSIVNVVMPKEVRDVADAMAHLDERWLHVRFTTTFAQEYTQGGDMENDCQYYWKMLDELRTFYRKAAEKGQAVVFYTDDSLDYFCRKP